VESERVQDERYLMAHVNDLQFLSFITAKMNIHGFSSPATASHCCFAISVVESLRSSPNGS
jgi:hypothetical protein